MHLLADYRNSPILTTSNALQGQVVGSIGDLDELLTQDEIEALAEDRTATSLFLNLGGSFDARSDLQLSADFSTSRLSGTDSSGGVEGFDSTGFEYSDVTQLIGNGWLRAGDVEIASLRWLEQPGTWHTGVGGGMVYRSPSWKVMLGYAYGIDAIRSGDRGAHSVGVLLQLDLEQANEAWIKREPAGRWRGVQRILGVLSN